MRKEKIRETDFNPNEELPRNRIAQFFDLAKTRFFDLLKLSFLLALFILPLFGVYFLFSLLIEGADAKYAFALYFYMSLAFIPCIFFFYIGLGGAVEPLKKMAWGEGYLGPTDFFKGIKRNIKASLVAGIIEGITAFVVMMGIMYLLIYAPASDNNWIMGVGIGLVIALGVLVTIANSFVLTQSTTYVNPMLAIYRNAFILTFARLPINLLIFVICPGTTIALFLIPTAATPYIGVALNVSFICFGMLIWVLNSISVFDIYINKEQHPDYYKKGLIKEENKEA